MANQPHPLAASAGIGISASLLGATLIPAGGLASVAAAAGLACLLGAPTATWLWTHRGPDDPVAEAASDAAALLLIAGLMGPIAATSPLFFLAVLGGWLALTLLGRHALVVVGLAWALGSALAVATALPHAVGTALLPVPSSAAELWPRIVVLAALLAGVGTAGWSTTLQRDPGDRGTPFVVAGLSVVALLAVAVAVAGRYGASLGTDTQLPTGLGLLLCGAGVASWSAARPNAARRRGLVGILATGWAAAAVAMGASELLPMVVDLLVPALIAMVLLRRARHAEGLARGGLAAWSLGLGAALVVAFQWPGSVADAVAVGGLAVGAFWAVMARAPHLAHAGAA